MAKPIQYCKVKKKSFTNQKTNKKKKQQGKNMVTDSNDNPKSSRKI